MSPEARASNVVSSARQYRSGEKEVTTGQIPDGQGFDVLYQQYKPELYALLPWLTDEIVQHAYNARKSRPPYGFIGEGEEWWQGENKPLIPAHFNPLELHTMSGPLRRTILQSMTSQLGAIDNGQSDPRLKRVFDRTDQIVNSFKGADPNNNQVVSRYNDGARGLLASGINFGTLVTTSCIDLVPRLSPSDNPAVLATIARNSLPFISRLTSGDLQKVSKAVNTLKTPEKYFLQPRFLPMLFELVQKTAGYEIEVNALGKRLLKMEGIDLNDLSSPDGQTPVCPASVNFGEGSGVKNLLNWGAEILEESYKQSPRRSREKFGRNDPCPCGSGQKYKRCHINS